GLTRTQPAARHAAPESAAQRWGRTAVVAMAAVGGPLTVIVFAVLLAAGAFAWQWIQVRDDLEGALDQSKALARAASSGDAGGIQSSGEDIL
ncbi:hypothetical protein ACUOIM_24480, partial [Escherichia coli]